VRVIKGAKTKLRNPTGVFLDLKHQEVWVSNLGSASAAAFPLMANGDVAPLRMIRSAPEGTRSLNFGRTASVTYDRNREQFLVPNCVKPSAVSPRYEALDGEHAVRAID
jgi:hypothetical protein